MFPLVTHYDCVRGKENVCFREFMQTLESNIKKGHPVDLYSYTLCNDTDGILSGLRVSPKSMDDVKRNIRFTLDKFHPGETVVLSATWSDKCTIRYEDRNLILSAVDSF